jgi:hypothetical protein
MEQLAKKDNLYLGRQTDYLSILGTEAEKIKAYLIRKKWILWILEAFFKLTLI